MLWEHETWASVSTTFRVLPNFHKCFYNTLETQFLTNQHAYFLGLFLKEYILQDIKYEICKLLRINTRLRFGKE